MSRPFGVVCQQCKKSSLINCKSVNYGRPSGFDYLRTEDLTCDGRSSDNPLSTHFVCSLEYTFPSNTCTCLLCASVRMWRIADAIVHQDVELVSMQYKLKQNRTSHLSNAK